MFTEYEIRRAHPADADDIAVAHRDSIRSIGPKFYPANVVEDWGEGLTPDIYVKAMEGGEVFFIATGQIDDKPVVLGFATHTPHRRRPGRGVCLCEGHGDATWDWLRALADC